LEISQYLKAEFQIPLKISSYWTLSNQQLGSYSQ